jgi:hypothetical protein
MANLRTRLSRSHYEATLRALRGRTNGSLSAKSSKAVLSLMALGLTGCKDSEGTPIYTSGGAAVKGPLANALVFIDLNGDGLLGAGELSTTTGVDGSYSFDTDDQALLLGDIVVKTNENTTDASSGQTLAGLTLTAKEGSTVVSPATTLIKTLLDADTAGTLTLAAVEAKVQAALGITADVDLSSFNPFTPDSDLVAAKQVEAVAQQIVAIVNTVSAAAEASGADKDSALSAAIEDLASQIDAAASASTSLNLADPTAINSVVSAVDAATGIVTDVNVAAAISNINSAIVTAVNSAVTLNDAREIFAIAQSSLTEAAVATAFGDTFIATQLGITSDVVALKSISSGAISITGNRVSVEESDEAISATGSLRLSDPDPTDAITYRVKEGSALLLGNSNPLGGTLTVGADGSWHYELDVTSDASKLALLQELQSKTYQGDLTSDDGAPALSNFQIVERFEVQIEKVDATVDSENPSITDATYADSTPIKKIVTVVINGVNDAVQALAEGEAISDVTDAFQGVAISEIDTSLYFIDNEVDAEDADGGATGAGDKLIFTALGLPEGLSIDPDTGIISGTPSNNIIGSFEIVVTATDIAGTSANQTFELTVNNTNDEPTLVSGVADQTVSEDTAFRLDTSEVFADADIQFNGYASNNLEDEKLTFSVKLEDGNALPNWLSFDATSGVFSGIPENGDVGSISVDLTATDIAGLSVTDNFLITVSNVNDVPTASNKTGVTLGDQNTLTIDASYLTGKIADDDIGDTLKVVSVSVTSGGGAVVETSAGSGVWTYTPADVDADTSVVLQYTVADIAGATATANIEVNVVDAIPVAEAVDEDTASVVVGYTGGTVTLNAGQESKGSLDGSTFTPAANFNGTVEFTIVLDSDGTALPGILVINQVNDAATGDVAISGVAKEDQTLAADVSGIADADDVGEFGYQWKANGVAVEGATEATYTLTQAEVGSAITVTASFTDGDGNAESKTSAATTPVENVNDLPVGSVSISDASPTEDQTLTVSNDLTDEDGLGTISYQWYADNVVIAGATGASLTLTDEALVGKAITVTATYTDGAGTPETKTSAATSVVSNVNDVPTASNKTGVTLGDQNTLTIDASYLTGKIADDDIGDTLKVVSVSVTSGGGAVVETSAGSGVWTYTPADVDADTSVVLQYTVADIAGATATANIEVNVVDAIPVAEAVDEDTASVVVGYTGGTVTLNAGQESKGSLDGSTFTPAANFNGTVEFTIVLDSDGTALPGILVINQVNDAATGDVAISGVAKEDQTLAADVSGIADADDVGEFGYQWKANGVAVEGATEATYTLTQAEVGSAITVTASFTDGDGNAESKTSAATTPVENVNDLPVGSVSILGTPEDGATLAVETSAISDEDGLGAFVYQWQENGSDILGANEETFVISRDLIGSVVSVKVSYTDQQNNAEDVISLETDLVEPSASSYVVNGTVVDNGSKNFTVILSLDSDNAENLTSIFGYSLKFDIEGESTSSDPSVLQIGAIGNKFASPADLFDGGDLASYYQQQFVADTRGDPLISDTPWSISGAGALAMVTSLDSYLEGGDLAGYELTDYIGSSAEIMSLNFTIDNDIVDFDLIVSGTVSDGNSNTETIVNLALDII